MSQGDLVDKCVFAVGKGVVVGRSPDAVQLDSRYDALFAFAREVVNLFKELGERSNHCFKHRNCIAQPLHRTNTLLQLSTCGQGVHFADTVTLK